LFLKIQTGTVDTVPDSSFILWPIIEDMPQMAITLAASDLCPYHAMTGVFDLDNLGFFELIVEGRPSAAAVVLGQG
jgi:hypothetical protein